MKTLLSISLLAVLASAALSQELNVTSTYGFESETVRTGFSVTGVRLFPRAGVTSPSLGVGVLFDNRAFESLIAQRTFGDFSRFYVGPVLNLPLATNGTYTLSAALSYTVGANDFRGVRSIGNGDFGLGVSVGVRF